MLTRIMLIVVAALLVTGALEFWFWRDRELAAKSANEEQDHRRQRRSSLLTEALACAGMILILSGSGVVLSQRWLHITDWERAGILAAAAACFLIAGVLVRWVSGSVRQGLTEALWVVSVACVGADTVILIAFGSCALLGYLTAAAINFSHGSLGIAETLMLVGALLIAMALMTLRLRRIARSSPSIPGTPEEQPPGQAPHHQEDTDLGGEGHGGVAHAKRARHEHVRAA